MRSIVGPSRTRRPRSANGSIRKGWTRSSSGRSEETVILERSGQPAGRRRIWRPPAQDRNVAPSVSSWKRLTRQAKLCFAESSAKAPGKNSLLGMKPVLRLVPYDRLWAVDDPGGDLLAAFDRQAVHEDRVGLGVRHQVLVDAVGSEHVVTIDVGFVAHRDPR